MHYNYDITKPQPQLFVTPDFEHLTSVLEEFKKLMAWTTGGLQGVRKAIDSQHTSTIVYSSGLQVTGTFIKVIEADGQSIFIQTEGPTALSVNNTELGDYPKEHFPMVFRHLSADLFRHPLQSRTRQTKISLTLALKWESLPY
jgi:phenylalanine-4-hydroxylase